MTLEETHEYKIYCSNKSCSCFKSVSKRSDRPEGWILFGVFGQNDAGGRTTTIEDEFCCWKCAFQALQTNDENDYSVACYNRNHQI